MKVLCGNALTYFHWNQKDILLCSPQGIQETDKKYLNLFQTGYFLGHLNDDKNLFTHEQFKELDYGHDFYAAQTTLAPGWQTYINRLDGNVGKSYA